MIKSLKVFENTTKHMDIIDFPYLFWLIKLSNKKKN